MGKILFSSSTKARLLRSFSDYDEDECRRKVQTDEETLLSTFSSSSSDSSQDHVEDMFAPSFSTERWNTNNQSPLLLRNELPWFENDAGLPEKPWYERLLILDPCYIASFIKNQILVWFLGEKLPYFPDRWQRNAFKQTLSLVVILIGFLFALVYVGRPNEAPMDIGPLPTPYQAREVLDEIRNTIPSRGFTIVTSSSRLHQLSSLVDHYATCSRVKEIQVLWMGPGALSSRLWDHPLVQESGTPPTNAILLLDPTVPHLPCDELNRAFDEWRRDATRMVGFLPLFLADTERADTERRYSLVSSRALFVHLRYLHSPLFYAGLSRQKNNDCESFAMAAKWTMISQLPPTAMALSRISMPSLPHNDKEKCYKRLLKATGQSSFPSTDILFSGRG